MEASIRKIEDFQVDDVLPNSGRRVFSINNTDRCLELRDDSENHTQCILFRDVEMFLPLVVHRKFQKKVFLGEAHRYSAEWTRIVRSDPLGELEVVEIKCRQAYLQNGPVEITVEEGLVTIKTVHRVVG